MSEISTHWPGCWESDTHGACARIHARAAVDHIHKLQEELAVVIVKRDKALEVLRECQQVLAMLTDPERIRKSRVQEAWAQAVAAELHARAMIASAEKE